MPHSHEKAVVFRARGSDRFDAFTLQLPSKEDTHRPDVSSKLQGFSAGIIEETKLVYDPLKGTYIIHHGVQVNDHLIKPTKHPKLYYMFSNLIKKRDSNNGIHQSTYPLLPYGLLCKISGCIDTTNASSNQQSQALFVQEYVSNDSIDAVQIFRKQSGCDFEFTTTLRGATLYAIEHIFRCNPTDEKVKVFTNMRIIRLLVDNTINPKRNKHEVLRNPEPYKDEPRKNEVNIFVALCDGCSLGLDDDVSTTIPMEPGKMYFLPHDTTYPLIVTSVCKAYVVHLKVSISRKKNKRCFALPSEDTCLERDSTFVVKQQKVKRPHLHDGTPDDTLDDEPEDTSEDTEDNLLEDNPTKNKNKNMVPQMKMSHVCSSSSAKKDSLC